MTVIIEVLLGDVFVSFGLKSMNCLCSLNTCAWLGKFFDFFVSSFLLRCADVSKCFFTICLLYYSCV